MLWLYRYFRGYINILICGEYAERVLNLCVSHRISIWDSILCKQGIKTNIYVSDFRLLRKIVRKSGVRIKILKKAGLPFKIAANRKRSGFLIGLIMMLVFLEFMSGFVWQIDIEGNSKVEEKEIIESCRKIGIHEGIRTASVNPKVAREKLLLGSDKLAWAALNIEGCRLTVKVTEIDTSKKTDSPCNLKASSDGVIKKIDVTVGNCLVKVGDTVEKGQVLVSGILEGANETAFVHSSGTIIAKTTQIFSSTGKYERKISQETGDIKTKYVLDLFGIKIPLFLGGEKREYISETEVKEARLMGKSLPIRLYKKTFEFCNTKSVVLSEQELEKELKDDINKKITEKNFQNYKPSEYKISKNEASMTVSVEVTGEENIAVAEDIIVSAKE